MGLVLLLRALIVQVILLLGENCPMPAIPRSVIFNADDFGLDNDTFAATRELLDGGFIKSATILTGRPMTSAAIAYGKAYQDNMSFGLHFNIAEGEPFCKTPVPSLVDRTGCFAGPLRQRIRALAGLLQEKDIVAEAESQLSYLRDHGLLISHLDSHGHLHKFPPVMRALRPVMQRFGIGRVRRPQTHYDNPRSYNRYLDLYCSRVFCGPEATTRSFFNTRLHEENWLSRLLERLPDGVTEVGIHPGRAETWRRIEFEALASGRAVTALAQAKANVSSYHDI
jgi:chitin disaccharide deacetylase